MVILEIYTDLTAAMRLHVQFEARPCGNIRNIDSPDCSDETATKGHDQDGKKFQIFR